MREREREKVEGIEICCRWRERVKLYVCKEREKEDEETATKPDAFP